MLQPVTNRFLQSSLQLDIFFSVSCANFDSFVPLEKEGEIVICVSVNSSLLET